MIRLASPEEIENWDDLVVNNPDGGHIYQSSEWAKIKQHNGWEPVHCIYEAAGYVLAFLLIRKPASILGNIYYCSKGPGFFVDFTIDKDSKAHFAEFTNELKHFIKQIDTQAILVKIEPELENEQKLDLAGLG